MRTNTLKQNVRFKVVLDTRRYQIIRINVYYNQYHFTGLEFSNFFFKVLGKVKIIDSNL